MVRPTPCPGGSPTIEPAAARRPVEGRSSSAPGSPAHHPAAAELLAQAARFGLVELIDVESAPLLRRALGRRADERNELIAIRLVPASAAAVQRACAELPMAALSRLAPVAVDLSSLRLSAPITVDLLDWVHRHGGFDDICVIAGSVQRRAELFSVTRPQVPVFASLADALQTLVFASSPEARRWSTPSSPTAHPPRR